MATIWISDFRGRQLQYCTNLDENIDSSSDIYIVDDTAEYSWLSSNAMVQLPLLSLDKANVVIMLGFNDCVYSCIWNTFNIDKIADDYIETVNSLIEQYPTFNFYFCSVNPISDNYPSAEYPTNSIPLVLLDTKIKAFNNKISTSCTATFIDSYTYLTSTSFEAYDGIRYNMNTYNVLRNYIENNFKVEGGINFVPRLTAPNSEDEEYLYWTHTSAGGYNECVKVNGNSVLPNCVGYAWGRFYEILNSKPTLSKGNAELWYQNNDGYERGDTPKLGAVICWRHGIVGDDSSISGIDAGHVAIVEEINEDTITISESAYGGFKDGSQFKTRQLKKGTSTDKESWWSYANNYYFQGFIYNPAVTSTSGTASQSQGQVTKADVTINNRSLTESEQQLNARYIWQYLGSKRDDKEGWSLNAVAALLGNMQAESSINPGRYEAYTYNESSSLWLGPNPTQSEIATWLEKYKSAKGRYPGFGLTQWTSTGATSWSQHKLVSWCSTNNLDPADIDSQLKRIEWEAENGQQWYGFEQDRKDYPISFKDFTTSTEEPEWLAAAFLLRYEIPGNRYDYVKARGENARRWYDFLLPYAPGFGPTFKAINFKVDTVDTTSVKASFVVTYGASGYYKLFDSNGNLLNTVNLTIENSEEPVIITFTQPGLVPNTDYELFIEVSSEDGSSKKEATLNFHTLQDFPTPVDNLKLELAEELSINPLFNLSTTLNSKWGYWKSNGYGFDLQLIINGTCIEEKVISNITNLNFKIEDYFNSYEIAIDDTIQIGARAWTIDNNRNKIYDDNYIKKSNSICLLKKPIIMYLNDKNNITIS